MYSSIRRIFFLLIWLGGFLVAPAVAEFSVVRTYDSTNVSNAVDQSATPLTVATFTASVAQAFDQNRGGVIDFDSGSIDVFNVLHANFGQNRAVEFTKLPGGTGNWSRAVISNGGLSGAPTAQGVLFGGASDFLLGPVLDATTGQPLSERVTQFGITIIDRRDKDLPISVTASYFNYVTQTAGDLPVVNFNILLGTSNQYDTFFGFTAPADSYLTRVQFSSTTGSIAHDDLGFVTSAVPEPSTWMLGIGAILAALKYRQHKRMLPQMDADIAQMRHGSMQMRTTELTM